MSVKSRIHAIFESLTSGPCPRCHGCHAAAGFVTFFDRGDTEPPPVPSCPKCGLEGLLLRIHVIQRPDPIPESEEL